MKKLVATAAALAVGVSVAMAEPNGEAAPAPDNKPAAQSPAPKVAKGHHKHHKHHKGKKAGKKAEKPAEQKPADNQGEQPK